MVQRSKAVSKGKFSNHGNIIVCKLCVIRVNSAGVGSNPVCVNIQNGFVSCTVIYF